MPIAVYSNFSGGKNEQLPPLIYENKSGKGMYYASDSLNIEMSETGLIKYPGTDGLVTTPAAGTVTGLFQYRTSTGTYENIICKNGKVYTQSEATETEIYTGGTVNEFYQAIQYGDVLILMNGVDTPLKYDGSTCAAITFIDPESIFGSAKPKGAFIFRDNIFYWGDSTNKSRLYKPRPQTYNNFDNANNTVDAFDVDLGGAGDVTGGIALTGDSAVIFKTNAIFEMNGTNPFGSGIDEIYIKEVTRETGCVAPRTIVQRGIDVFFLGNNGLRQLSTVVKTGGLSIESQPSYLIQTSMNALNYAPNIIKNACAIYFPPTNRIYFSVPTRGSITNNQLFVYDVITKTNEPGDWADEAASFGLHSKTTNGIYSRYIAIGEYSDGQVYQFDTGNSWDGTAINSYWESFWIAHGGLSFKRYKKLVIYADTLGTTSLTIKWGVLRRGQASYVVATESGTSTAGIWDVGVWDVATWASVEPSPWKRNINARGDAFKLRISNNSTSATPIVRAIELHYEIFGMVRG